MPLHVICIHHAPSTRHTCASTPVSAPQEKTGHTVAGGRDRVEADAIGLVLLGVDAGGEHAVRLALPVGKLACKQSVCVEFSANLSFKGRTLHAYEHHGKTQRSAQVERILTLVVDDDVAGLAGGVGADHARDRHDLADERVLGLGDVDSHAGLVPVPANHTDKKQTTRSTLCGQHV